MSQSRTATAGFTLSEALVVVAIIGIAVAIGIPLVSEQVRSIKIRGAADQLSMDLKAARMIAVSKRTTVNLTVTTHPTNSYQYTDTHGKLRRIQLPSGVRIVSSTSPIQFLSNGSVTGGASTVMEADMTGSVFERWTITTSILGVSTIAHERLES